MEHTPEIASPEILKLLASLREASQKAKSYRELESIIHEHTQIIARSQFSEQAAQLEHRLEQDQKKTAPTVVNP
jgi:hypothetical protein